VFVTPQYNWGIPAGLKNALDYLFHEWGGKPAVVVTYGGHGGGKCGEAMQVVLGGGLNMRVVEPVVGLAFPGRSFLVKAAKGEHLGLEDAAADTIWVEERAAILTAWEAMLAELAKGKIIIPEKPGSRKH
jgi:NAD(P)H-dependent FMN reductase